ncbi:DUF732 domain-containing protein [Mycolicibacterium fortuitum]|uniref:DUF732 domain-containing protein n=1 Tax=Mycolicibacterium fortuitum TaxID=1766 RepID=UPI00262E0E09|nr:DUF732 domain-containing protein [Mycolicibacterium fortuitum]
MSARHGITAAIAAIALTACGTNTQTAAPTPSSTSRPAGERQFLGSVHTDPFWVGWTDESLIEKGHAVCDSVADGPAALSTTTQILMKRFGPGQADSMVSAAQKHLCPPA